MRHFRRSLLCLATLAGGYDTFAIADEPPKEQSPISPEALRAAEALRAEIAKAPFLQDLPSISRWKDPWARDIARLWLCGANGEDIVLLRYGQFDRERHTYDGELEVRRKGSLISARRELTVCYAPFHYVEPPCGQFIVLLRPVETERGQRVGAVVYEVPSLREAATIVPEKSDDKTSLVGLHDYVAVSQNGRTLAIATGYVDLGVSVFGGDGSIEIHAGVPLRLVRTVPPLSKDARVIRLRFSRDGRHLAAVYRDLKRRHHLRVFEAPTWEGSNLVAVNDDFLGMSAPVWTDDGQAVYHHRGRSDFKDGRLEAPKELSELAADMNVCLATRTPGKFLAVGGYDIRINHGARVVAQIRRGMQSPIVALSDDGRRLAAWTNEGGLGLWDIDTILKPR